MSALAVVILTVLSLPRVARVRDAHVFAPRPVARAPRRGAARRKREAMLEPTVTRLNELVLATAIGRLLSNTLILLGVLYLFERAGASVVTRFGLSLVIAGFLSLLFSVALPHALARHAGDSIVASTVGFLHGLRVVLLPITLPMRWIDDLIRRAVGVAAGQRGRAHRAGDPVGGRGRGGRGDRRRAGAGDDRVGHLVPRHHRRPDHERARRRSSGWSCTRAWTT